MRNFAVPARSVEITKQSRKFVAILALACCAVAQSTFSAVAQAPADIDVATVAGASLPVAQPDAQRTMIVILVKNALLAVNQGNLTGNYTVLRDLASPGFREKNTAADLAAIFQTVRQQKLDMSAIVALEPALNQPRVTADGQVALDGYFEAQQMRINFQLIFLKAPTNGWMIHGISLNAVPIVTTTAAAARQ